MLYNSSTAVASSALKSLLNAGLKLTVQIICYMLLYVIEWYGRALMYHKLHDNYLINLTTTKPSRGLTCSLSYDRYHKFIMCTEDMDHA
jgi:hypothetical protein